jgi:O-6-methylguanine DNA methyltransferase
MDFNLHYIIRNEIERIEFISKDIAFKNENSSTNQENSVNILLNTIFSEYFSRKVIDNLKLTEELDIFSTKPFQKSDFKKRVLKKVSEIPFGEIKSYKDIASSLNSRAYRAIGTILANNPFPILIPCHRIVPEQYRNQMKKEIIPEKIGGFMGTTNHQQKEIHIKYQLLKHEAEDNL